VAFGSSAVGTYLRTFASVAGLDWSQSDARTLFDPISIMRWFFVSMLIAS
jgi:hypothetical protein